MFGTSQPLFEDNFSSFNLILILVQILCSCLAGVYNEYLLKNTGADVNIYVQNVFMYLDSILCNFMVLLMQGNVHTVLSWENLYQVCHLKVIVVIINNAAIGIITSFFLKTLNSILKNFASAIELILTAIASFILFGIPIYMNTVLALCTVMYATYLYSQNPVNNAPVKAKVPKIEEPLLEEV